MTKIMGILLFGQFCVSTPFLLLTMLRNNEQKLRQAMLWICNILQGERGNSFLNKNFLKFPLYYFTDMLGFGFFDKFIDFPKIFYFPKAPMLCVVLQLVYKVYFAIYFDIFAVSETQ